uniref:PQ-loop repeat-containing protein n=1 Tax=viral metagenome TaxID=1070528 RepID=A0A6C0KTD1_9ZZZZ
MNSDYLMYTTTFLYLSCYIPELYANYKNKNSNIYNIPEKIIMLVATSCGLTYALLNNNTALITNYAPLLSLDVIALLMRLYYAYENNLSSNSNNNNDNNNRESESKSETETETDSDTDSDYVIRFDI